MLRRSHLALTLALLAPASARAQSVAVVVSSDVDVKSLTRAELARILRDGVGAGRVWTPLLPERQDPFSAVLARTLGTDADTLYGHFVAERLRGHTVRTQQLSSVADIAQAIRETRDGIAVLPWAAAQGLEIIRVSGIETSKRPLPSQVSPRRQVGLLTRALLYDQARKHSRLRVIILHGGDAAGARALAEAFDQSRARVRVEAVVIAAGDSAGLTRIAQGDAAAVYLWPDLSSDIPRVLTETRAAGLVTMTSSRALMERGACLGVEAGAGGRAQLLVNQSACSQEGARFGASLLRFAKRI